MSGISRCRLQLREQVLQVVRRMLHVEEQPVETRAGKDFHAVVRREARPQTDLRARGFQRALECILWQVHGAIASPRRAIGWR